MTQEGSRLTSTGVPTAARTEDADPGLWDALVAQVQAVDARVTEAGVYAHESIEVRRAALEVPVLCRDLRLRRYLGSITPATGKPQFLLLFDDGPDEAGRGGRGGAVLKVYGRSRPAEAALQRRWFSDGLPTPRVLASGDDPVSWVLLEHVPTRPLAVTTSSEVLGLTRDVAGILRRVHAAGPVAGHCAVPLGDGVMPHLVAVVASLVAHGYSPPAGWHEAAAASYAAGQPVTLHGDLFPGNLLNAERGLLIIDSCGYWGDPSFDAARWSVRVANASCSADQVLAAWVEVEQLHIPTARLMLGVESLMQAGVREIVKVESQQETAGPDPVTAALLADCARYWDGL